MRPPATCPQTVSHGPTEGHRSAATCFALWPCCCPASDAARQPSARARPSGARPASIVPASPPRRGEGLRFRGEGAATTRRTAERRREKEKVIDFVFHFLLSSSCTQHVVPHPRIASCGCRGGASGRGFGGQHQRTGILSVLDVRPIRLLSPLGSSPKRGTDQEFPFVGCGFCHPPSDRDKGLYRFLVARVHVTRSMNIPHLLAKAFKLND